MPGLKVVFMTLRATLADVNPGGFTGQSSTGSHVLECFWSLSLRCCLLRGVGQREAANRSIRLPKSTAPAACLPLAADPRLHSVTEVVLGQAIATARSRRGAGRGGKSVSGLPSRQEDSGSPPA